jgi:hypothetical protein
MWNARHVCVCVCVCVCVYARARVCVYEKSLSGRVVEGVCEMFTSE